MNIRNRGDRIQCRRINPGGNPKYKFICSFPATTLLWDDIDVELIAKLAEREREQLQAFLVKRREAQERAASHKQFFAVAGVLANTKRFVDKTEPMDLIRGVVRGAVADGYSAEVLALVAEMMPVAFACNVPLNEDGRSMVASLKTIKNLLAKHGHTFRG